MEIVMQNLMQRFVCVWPYVLTISHMQHNIILCSYEDSFNPRLRVCCDEEIIKNGHDGFSGGDYIQTVLSKDCTKFAKFDAKTDKLMIRLVSFFAVSIVHMVNT